MVLTVNSKNMNRMLYGAVFFMFIMGSLVHDLGLPIGIMAVLDMIVFLALLFSLRFFQNRIRHTKAGTVILISVILLSVGVLYALVSRVPLGLLIDGIRNNFRGMATFFVTVCLLQKETTKRILRLMDSFFLINVVVCTIQFFFLGVSHDNCNGLFGAGNMNSWTNILLCVISVYYISKYMNRLIPLRKMAIRVMLCLYVAMLAELKAYFFELVIIVLVLVLLEKPSLRTWIICGVGGLLLFGMSSLFIAFWEDDSMFTIEGLKYYFDADRSYGYSSQGDWGRIGGIANATKKFFSNGINLFGMGLGYCGFDTPFYFRYGWLKYNWFSYLAIFLEQGWVGIVGYVSFFVVNFLTLRRKKKKILSAEAKAVYDVSLVMSVLGIFLLVYNSSVTGYPAFFLFLCMGMAYRSELDEGAVPAGKAHAQLHSIRETGNTVLKS